MAAREAAGQVNVGSHRPSRTVAQILRANAFTRFNAILGVLLVVIVVVGPLQDALPPADSRRSGDDAGERRDRGGR